MPALDNTEAGCGCVFINRSCRDISKEKCEAIHQAVFGYSLAVNPTEFLGRMVVKSNLNGAHDGKEVLGPLKSVEPGVVYQRVVNNQPSVLKDDLSRGDVVCDIRVPMFAGTAPFVYLKYRPTSKRFSNTNSSVQLVEIASVFNNAEYELLRLFCKQFGLDYGEVDVVRDAEDSRIYVLDVNKTPLGPPNGLSTAKQRLAMDLYHQAFLKLFTDLGLMDGYPGASDTLSQAR